jgi:hypothetical protein
VARAQAAGLNTIRIVNPLNEGGSVATEPTREAAWVRVDALIAAAEQADLLVILDLSTYRNLLYRNNINPYTRDWKPFLTFVANRTNTVSGRVYKEDPTIAIVSLAGEVEPPNGSQNTLGVTKAQVTEFFRVAGAAWKSLDTNHILSSGGLLQLDWDSGIDWKAIFGLSSMDICSIHNYSSNDSTKTTPAVAAHCASIGKPWINEEFGWVQSIGDSTRAANYRAMYDRQRTYNSAGAAFWNLGPEVTGASHDVNQQTPLTWAVVRDQED